MLVLPFMAERTSMGGDAQLRIWHIGTQHDYQPDDSSNSRFTIGWTLVSKSQKDRTLPLPLRWSICLPIS